MNKFQLKESKHIIIDWFKFWKWNENFQNQKEYLKSLINHIFENPEWKNIEYSTLDTEVFWKMNKKQKKQLFDYIDWNIEDKKVKKELNLFWKKIINLLSSIYSEVPNTESKTVQTKIEQEMKTAWQALERFIIYSIENFWTDINLSTGKSKIEYEGEKIDFYSKYKIHWTNKQIHFANQLTVKIDITKKQQEINNLAYIIDNPTKYKNIDTTQLTQNNYREENIPDLPILFLIKNWLQQFVIKNNRMLYNNDFNHTYQKIWINNPIENIWKKNQDKKNNSKYLKSIWTSYSVLISYFIEKIKEIDLSKDFSDKSYKIWKWHADIDYNNKTNIFRIHFLKSDNTAYILEFYLTNKFLKKLWIDFNVQRNIKKTKK